MPEISDQLFDFPNLFPLLALDHGERQIAEIRSARLRRASGGPFEQAGRRKLLVQPMRHFAEKWELLFQVNIDAPKENRDAAALILLVQGHRQVKWDHQDFVALPAKFGDQRVIAKTIAAIHPASPWCDLNDPHAPCPCRTYYRFPRSLWQELAA